MEMSRSNERGAPSRSPPAPSRLSPDPHRRARTRKDDTVNIAQTLHSVKCPSIQPTVPVVKTATTPPVRYREPLQLLFPGFATLDRKAVPAQGQLPPQRSTPDCKRRRGTKSTLLLQQVRVTGNISAWILNEAEAAFRTHPGTPAGWKRNIRPFLVKCAREYPYISSWVWATKALNEWCRAAPFRYFKLVLMNPKKFRMEIGQPVRQKWEVFKWLLRTKGRIVATAYKKRVGLRAWWEKTPRPGEKSEWQIHKEQMVAAAISLGVRREPEVPQEVIERELHEMRERKRALGWA